MANQDNQNTEILSDFKTEYENFNLFINSTHFELLFPQFIVSEYFLFKDNIIPILEIENKIKLGKNIQHYTDKLKIAKEAYREAVKSFLTNHPKNTGVVKTQLRDISKEKVEINFDNSNEWIHYKNTIDDYSFSLHHSNFAQMYNEFCEKYFPKSHDGKPFKRLNISKRISSDK
ncbi:hypothetical protein R3X25_11765 [Lutibacter sp. TH_r2]|uniref:hypothetical protein n=1 Tax=Lutibacter sp. TH_r2 TaxID=3082083 RepID=UPI002952D3FB|nr:hypothetical protein [Lutibacter sp. TH_r2]MDV7187960.1 hypothetical protein [Lutibacter sp. TH_r2]